MRIVLSLCLVATLGWAAKGLAADRATRIYIGTYGQGPGDGIFVADWNGDSGTVGTPQLAGRAVNASFLALDPGGRRLYAVSEVDSTDGKPTGGVTAFAIDAKTGKLSPLNAVPSGGAGPCYLVVDKPGKNVLVANYDGGTIAVLPLSEDGRLKPFSARIRHRGKSINPERQEAPHAHSINLDAANRYAFAADLGLDKILVYKFNPDKGTLLPNEPAAVTIAPGSGPRHFAFHPSGRFAYVIDELANTIVAFWYDAETGNLSTVQTVSTLPADFKKPSYTAEVVVHPSGKFVYGSNRGHDSIAMFSVDAVSGRLTSLGQEPTQGKNPRNFVIDPRGAYLLAANQDSGTVVVFRIDPESGKLRPTGQTVKVPKPVCIKFASPG